MRKGDPLSRCIGGKGASASGHNRHATWHGAYYSGKYSTLCAGSSQVVGLFAFKDVSIIDTLGGRRGKAETDPIKVSRILKFLEEYWTEKGEYTTGRGNRHNAELKTQSDLAGFVGEDIRTAKRILKLNDLIPEIQALVSSGKLGTTAAEQYAYISPENLHNAIYNLRK